MLKLTIRNWTSQINSMRVEALECLIIVGWYQDLHRMSWRPIHYPWHQDEMGLSGIEEETGVTTVVVSPWEYHCGYVRIGVCGFRVYSGARSLALRSHMFVQSEQGSYEYYWIWYRPIKVWMTKWWRVWCRWQQCANFCVRWLWVVFPYFYWWGAVGTRGQVACVLGCWVLSVEYGPPRWSCCIEVPGNRWCLLYSWVDGENGSGVVSCSRLVFYRVLI